MQKYYRVNRFYAVILSLSLSAVSFTAHAGEDNKLLNKPLTDAELVQLVSGNSMIGTTYHTHSLYELYFYPDHRLLFRKAGDNKQTYLGKWWVKNDTISSQWPGYLKKPTTNTLKYYQVSRNTYRGYNVNDACGPSGTFCPYFVVIPGKIPSLDEASAAVGKGLK